MLKAVPTLILLVLLHAYLNWAFYGPMDRLLERRREATEGARLAAEEGLRRAEEKAAAYEEALRRARAELFAEQEQRRAKLRQEQAEILARTRRAMEALVRDARAQLAHEAAAARRALEADSDALAEEIVHSLLPRRLT